MNTIYDTLNDRQKEAVLHTDGPLLILAGAGSGKTRVLTHRIAYLIAEKGVNPWNILAITFTNKAAHEMRERVDKIAGSEGGSVWVSTFHSTCVRILRRHIDRLGYDNNFTIYDADDQKTLIKEICRKMNIDTKKVKERALLAQISHAKDELLNPDEMEMNAGADFNQKRAAQVYREYQAALRRNNALDFDDLICKTVELFQNCGDVLQSYQERFRYIMVDEYQDTNTAQFKFVSLLASRYENLCVVGDDDQSIYRFRGANIGNILGFERVFPDAKVIRLEQNYRSTQNILNAANGVIANNTERKEKTLWTENPEGEKIHFRQFMNGYEEAEFVVGDIARRHREGTAEYHNCAVLYRTNAQSRLFEEKCLLANIPYKIVGGVNFYARKEIKDLLCYLKTVDNAADDLAVRRILNVPKRGIGATTVGRIQDYADMMNISFYDALRVAEEVPSIGRSLSKVDGFVTFIQSLKSKAQAYSVSELLEEIIDLTGYVDELKAEDTEEARARVENIDELISKTVSYEETMKAENREATLSGFLEEIALIADIDSVDENQDYVVLMTLHSAKGLEFPYVYLAGMEDGMFPSSMCIFSGDQSDLEEERRLCYVGITRAKEDLTLTCAKSRMLRGETQYNPVSRFVREIPKELLDNTLPPSRRYRDDDLEDFQARRANEAALRAMGLEAIASPRSGSGSDSGFGGFGNTGFDPRPKATLKPRVTAKADKPYISKGISGLNQLAGLQKGTEFKAPEKLDYEVGDRVRHIKYGEGTVLNIVREPRDYKVTVEFDQAGQKIMYASFAKLKQL